MRTETITVTLTGADGSASGNKTSTHPVSGIPMGYKVDVGTQPNTLDVTITTPNEPTATLLTLTNVAASAWYFPRYAAHGNTGTASATDLVYHPVNDHIKVAGAQGNAGTFTVYVMYQD